MLEANKLNATWKFPLKGLFIGAPYVSPLTVKTNLHWLAAGLNILSKDQLDQVSVLYQRCEQMVSTNIT